MRRYGTLHALTDFIAATIPKRGSGADLFVHSVMAGLKRLDAVQESNPAVTLAVSAGGGIWVAHQGQRQFMIIPGQKAVRVLTGWPEGKFAKAFRKAARQRRVTDVTMHDDYHQWRVPEDSLHLIWEWVEGMPKGSTALIEQPRHPRTFPGAARQAALELFERGGSICPGTRGRKRHRVDLKRGERIEFDHILPYSRGGPSTEWNLQVLCQECNRLKRANSG